MNEEKIKRPGSKKLLIAAALCLALIAGMQTHTAIADDTGDETAAPSFSNPAQAQHAANLALAAASQSDEELGTLREAIAQAEDNLNAAIESEADDETIQAAEDRLAEAQDAYSAELSERTGVLTSEIGAMRDDGMGWGQIAHELGVHPGLLGLGHTKKTQHQEKFAGPYGDDIGGDETESGEIAEATRRNTYSGWSQGHGVGLHTGVDGSDKTKIGKALGLAKKGNTGDAGSEGGISGTAGLSGSKSQAGGQGGGRGSAGSDGGPGNSGGDKGNSGSSNGNNGGGNGHGHGKGGGKSN